MDKEEAIKIVKSHYPANKQMLNEALEFLIPELKEKTDEEMIQKLIAVVHLYYGEGEDIERDECLEWLEKQSEQKTADKVEPKFHEGDTIVEKDFFECDYETIKDIKDGKYIFTDGSTMNINEQDEWLLIKSPTVIEQNTTDTYYRLNCKPKFEVGDWIVQENIGVYQVIEVCESWYEVVDNKDKDYSIGFDKEHMLRLWTIEDAKDGDILAVDNMIFTYKRTLASHIISYCRLINDTFEPFDDTRTCCEGNSNVHPATKEQRALLFSKMKEEEYSWDSDKKELKNLIKHL